MIRRGPRVRLLPRPATEDEWRIWLSSTRPESWVARIEFRASGDRDWKHVGFEYGGTPEQAEANAYVEIKKRIEYEATKRQVKERGAIKTVTSREALAL
jgi:hypothetical protein